MRGLLSLFMKRDQSSFFLCHVTTQQESGHLQGGKMVSPGTQTVSTLVLDFRPTELRDQCVWLSLPGWGILLQQPELT